MIRGSRGQALLEAVLMAPLLIGGCFLLLAFFFAAGTSSLLRYQVDESLICLTSSPQPLCEKYFHDFIHQSGLVHTKAKVRFLQQGSKWTAIVQFQALWGKTLSFSRSVDKNLSANLRSKKPMAL